MLECLRGRHAAQVGGAFAATLLPSLGVLGTTALRLVIAGVLLALVTAPLLQVALSVVGAVVLVLGLGADVVGPAPTTSATTSTTRAEHLVVRPGTAGAEQVRGHLAALRATESGHKSADPVQVRVGPHVLDRGL